MKTDSQNSQILAYLETGLSLTAVQALTKFGSFRLASRIRELKNDGHNIESVMIETETGKRVARYKYCF